MGIDRLNYIRGIAKNDANDAFVNTLIATINNTAEAKLILGDAFNYLLDIIIFLQSVSVYQTPFNYPQILSSGSQNINKLSLILQSTEIEKEGGLRKAGKFSGVYSDSRLKIFLDSYKDQVLTDELNARYPLLLFSTNHVIFLAYDKENNTWLINDHGQPKSHEGTENTVSAIRKCFDIAAEKKMLLATEVYAVGSDKKADQFVKTWGETIDLKDKPPVEGDDLYRWFLLAAKHGDINSIENLTQTTANNPTLMNARNNLGQTALHLAALNGHTAVVEYLFDNGVCINQASKKGYTALHLAALYGHEEVVQCLLANGARINQANKKGYTALHLAALYGHAAVVQCLLARGSNAAATAFNLAKKRGHADVTGPMETTSHKARKTAASLFSAAQRNRVVADSTPRLTMQPSPP